MGTMIFCKVRICFLDRHILRAPECEGMMVIHGGGWPKMGVLPIRVKKVFPRRCGLAWRIHSLCRVWRGSL